MINPLFTDVAFRRDSEGDGSGYYESGGVKSSAPVPSACLALGALAHSCSGSFVGSILRHCHSSCRFSPGFFCFSRQWACCATFKYLASAFCSLCSMLQKPFTSPSSTCIDLLQGDSMYVKYGGDSYMLYLQQQYILHAHSMWMYWQ